MAANTFDGISTKQFVSMAIAFSVLLLGGCNGGGLGELDRYFAEHRSKPAAPIDPIPEVKPYIRFTYPTHEKDPFDASMLAPEVAEEEVISDTGVTIDTTRVPEFLESFPLDSLRMVGTVEKDDVLWALIKIPDGAVQSVKPGNYLGQNYGKIVNITDVQMDMIETVSNGLGGYEEREISIALNQE